METPASSSESDDETMKEDLERIVLETQLNDHVDSIFAGPSMERIVIVSDGEDEKEEKEAEDMEDLPSCAVREVEAAWEELEAMLEARQRQEAEAWRHLLEKRQEAAKAEAWWEELQARRRQDAETLRHFRGEAASKEASTQEAREDQGRMKQKGEAEEAPEWLKSFD